MTQGTASLTYDTKGNVTAAPGGGSYAYNNRNLEVLVPGGYLYYDPAGRLDTIGPNTASPTETLFDFDGGC